VATLTVKNIPDPLYRRLKKSARENRRSLNNEIIVCVERALERRPVDTEETLARARELRRKTSDHRLSVRELNRTKRIGRP